MAFQKRYLSANERENLIIIAAMEGEAEDMIARWRLLSKENKKYLRMVKTLSRKVIDSILLNLNPEDVRRTVTAAKHMKLITSYTPTEKESNVYALMDEEQALAVCEMFTEHRCDKCNGKVKDCTYKDIMVGWNIDPYRVTCDDGVCPYSYIEEV